MRGLQERDSDGSRELVNSQPRPGGREEAALGGSQAVGGGEGARSREECARASRALNA